MILIMQLTKIRPQDIILYICIVNVIFIFNLYTPTQIYIFL